MGQNILVESQIEDGKRLAERLAQGDFPVTCAGWVRTTEDGMWYLYIATPLVDAEGPRKSYRRVSMLMREIPQPFWIDALDVNLIGVSHRLVDGVKELRQRFPGNRAIHVGEMQLGGVSIDGAYIYPPVTAAVKN